MCYLEQHSDPYIYNQLWPNLYPGQGSTAKENLNRVWRTKNAKKNWKRRQWQRDLLSF